MNKKTFILSCSLLAAGLCAYAQAPAQNEAKPKTTVELIRDAQNAARSKDEAKTSAAYALVFERDDLTPAQRYAAFMDIATLYRNAGKRPEAEKNYYSAAAIEGIKPEEKTRAIEQKNNMFYDAARQTARANKLEDTVKAYTDFLAIKDITPAMRFNAHIELKNAYDRDKKPNEGFAEIQKAAAIEGLSAKDALRGVIMIGEKYVRDNFPQSGNGAYISDGLNNAYDTYEKALSNPAFGNQEKIELYKRMANCRLEFMDLDGAIAILDKALALKDMTPEDKFMATYNKADVFYRALEYKKALDLFNEAQKFTGEFKENDQRLKNLSGRIASCIRELETPEERKARIDKIKTSSTVKSGDMISALREEGDLDGAAKLYDAILADKEKNLNDRSNALRDVVTMYYNAGDHLKAKTFAEKYADGIIAEDKGRHGGFYRNVMLGSNLQHRGINRVPDTFVWVINKHIEHNGPDFALVKALIDTEVARGDYKAAEKAADLGLTIKDIKGDQKLELEMMKLIVKTNGKPGSIGKDLSKLITSSIEKISENDKAKKLLDGARIAMKLKMFDVAKAIWKEREGLILGNEKPSLTVPFMEKAPKNITDFVNSAHFKDAKNRGYLNRKYGNNLQFLLETDAALTGRIVTEDTGGNEFTSFVAVCDPEGVKFFFYMPCKDKKRLEQIRDGFTGMGGFESYLAPGFYAPYSCYLIDCPPWNNVSVFETQYDNYSHRNMSVDKKNMKIDFELLDDAVGCMLSIDWSVFVNELPVNGTIWEFEPIHWERGGWSWGGSESVHHRSSFGNLIFANMTPENRTKIMRRLLVKAKNAWNQANSPHGGLIEHWQDPELGDLKFNAEVVVPFKNKYYDYANRIKADMTDEEVNTIFNEAFPTLINAYFIIQEMRKNYLDEQRVKGE